MNIIIPLYFKEEEFCKKNYNKPPPLIQILEKYMINYIIDNLNIYKEDKIFIIYNDILDIYQFSEYIINNYPFVYLIKINNSKSIVETLFLGIENILNNLKYENKCLILNYDTFYTFNIQNIFKNSNDNIIFYKKNYEINPIYSYIELDDDSNIINIHEKKKISDNINTGAYFFNDIKILKEYCKYIFDNNITINNEYYISSVIYEMIKKNIKFIGYEIQEKYIFSLGTQSELEKYINNTYAFLFDLDGTIVITDDIYFDVWSEILIKYNIILTKDIFENFIQGNNDKYVLNNLLINIDLTLIELSNLKDDLFIKNINKIKINSGIHNILKKIKLLGYKACIVTNCNKIVAHEIIKYININTLIDFVISNDDCINGKPDSEPYIKAIQKYNISNNKCIIFEDSKTGILSGKGVNPKLLIGIETIYNSYELLNIGVNLSIKDYCNLNINDLINNNSNKINYFKNLIKNNSIIQDIKDIFINENKLKGGFIADVISFKIITNNDNSYSQILKYESFEKNNLSIMAKILELYEREYYFYTNISKHININIPKFYNLIIDEKYNNIGIILENLVDKNYKINLNLNIENIDITLKIVDRMAKMHSKFWNKNLKKLFPNLKNSTDPLFNPFLQNFINDRYEIFKNKWFKNLTLKQKEICNKIHIDFFNIQSSFSIGNNLTFIHGDIKSPNIFYDINNNYEPFFIDWQHCCIGKGVQDLIFFVLESFDIINIKNIFYLTKYYYYQKLLEYGIKNYCFDEYEKDIYNAICYIPFFTSIWFGTTPQDELIDKNFPYFLISKMFYLINVVNN
jgi:HAD superfamily hydrolase (TIGR01509 family)